MKLLNTIAHNRALTIFALLAALSSLILFSRYFNSHAQKQSTSDLVFAGTIAGRVFQDFNGNGTYDTTSTIANLGPGTIGMAIDRGVQNVEVRAFNAAGANVTPGAVVLTDASGNYTFATSDAGSGPYRLEFTALPTGYSPSTRTKASTGSGTALNSASTVQFVSTPATNVNLAINYPTDYSQNNPEVVAALYTDGNQTTGGNNGESVLLSFPYSSGSNDTSVTATEASFDLPTSWALNMPANTIGTTFGLAYARRTQIIYAAAFFKRHAGFGPQTANTIYRVNRTGTGPVAGFFNVPGTVTNAHDVLDYNHDNGNIGWDAVGKTSLGGLALSENESTLYVVNLANRTVYSLNATTGVQIASQTVPATLPLPVGSCPALDVRPFALTMYHGQLYAGLVCSAESSTNADTFTDTNANGVWDAGDYFIDANGNNIREATESYYELSGPGVYTAPEPFTDGDQNGIYNLGDARNLRAYVYTVNPATLAFSAAPVFQMPLNYRRGLGTHTMSANGTWRPWSAIYRSSLLGNRSVYSQPMLTDIAFDNGNLILGLRDRSGDQVGNGALSNPGDASLVNFYQPRTSGDIIRACGPLNAWTVESNGRCGGTGTAPQNVAEGPGGGEFYFGDAYDLSADFVSPVVNVVGKGGNHDDTGNGNVEQLPGAPDVVITDFDPIPNIPNMTHDGGLRWLNNTTGAFTKGYRLFNGVGSDPDVFGKAGGTGGSMALLSNPAPIEIGNRIWRDTNGNGVQDPGENPIAAVTAHLYSGLAVVGTAVTDVNGEYYFVSSVVPDSNITDNIGQVNGGVLYNTTYQVRFDLPANHASGGPLFGLSATLPNRTAQLGDDDANDSDAASILNPAGSPPGSWPVIAVTTGGPGSNDHKFDVGFILGPSAAGVAVQGRVALSAGNGIRNVMVTLTEADGSFHTTVTGSFGYYRFDDISAGQSVLVSVAAKRYSFSEPVRSVSLTENLADFDFVANE